MKYTILLPCMAFAGSALAWVELDPSIIPLVKEPLPVFKLGAPASLPVDFLNDLIQEANPGIKLQRNETMGPGLFAYDGDRLVAFVDQGTGETQIFPNIAALKSTNEIEFANTKRVWSFLSVNGSFPADDTNITVTPGETLYGTTSYSDNGPSVSAVVAPNNTTPEIYWTNGIVERTVVYNNVTYPVCGPGSQATFSVTPEERIASLAYYWRPAFRTNQTISANSTAIVIGSIKAQLEPIGFKSGLVKVNKVEVCFYDSGVSAMQPVYRYFGYSHANKNSTVTSPTPITGYIAIGAGSPEFIPILNEVVTTNPPTEANNTLAARAPPSYFEVRSDLQRRGVKPRVKVARYVVRHDVDQWVKSANNFWNNLSNRVADFTNDQYYWAYPFLYTTSKDQFINEAHIALTEAHGTYHLFSTERNCCDLVDIDSDIPNTPTSGYGGGAAKSGDLAYWIIHSCEVLPTPTDYAPADRLKAYAPWWDVFNGMHAVLSYRTQMFISDNAAGATAKAISMGAPVVGAWMKAVHEDRSYRGSPTYFDTNVNRQQPYGRASAIFVCGHENDRVWQVENLGRPGCLRTVWYNN
ncbi:hypothetical protein BKA70DRAFT_125827 [Coprinopsis sp. MPI-PUGE-AT-0042]|nr:hypothetical protein BKA70DRAFT_125827 [Coprinopsis sp. MPI-PUGE-AT-0042]